MTSLQQHAPRAHDASELERQIAAIWSKILLIDVSDVNANFFDLGGSSLKMVRVHADLKRDLGLDVTIIDLFGYPTIAALTRRLLEAGPAHSAQAANSQTKPVRETHPTPNFQKMFRPYRKPAG